MCLAQFIIEHVLQYEISESLSFNAFHSKMTITYFVHLQTDSCANLMAHSNLHRNVHIVKLIIIIERRKI